MGTIRSPLPSGSGWSGGGIAYSSSFSKTFAPGLRVGWFVPPEPLAREVELVANGTYIGPVLLGQAAAHEFVSRGLFEPNLERVRELLDAAQHGRLERIAAGRTDADDDQVLGAEHALDFIGGLDIAMALRHHRGRVDDDLLAGREKAQHGRDQCDHHDDGAPVPDHGLGQAAQERRGSLLDG